MLFGSADEKRSEPIRFPSSEAYSAASIEIAVSIVNGSRSVVVSSFICVGTPRSAKKEAWKEVEAMKKEGKAEQQKGQEEQRERRAAADAADHDHYHSPSTHSTAHLAHRTSPLGGSRDPARSPALAAVAGRCAAAGEGVG